MTVTFAIQQSGVSSGSVKPPPTKATVETTLQGMTPEGNLQVSFSYPSFEVLKGGEASKSARRRIEQAFAGLAGLSGQLTLTPQGVLVDSALNVPPNIDPSVSSLVTQLGDQLRTLAIPFPEAAVGVGARWRASTDLSLNGIEAHQVVRVHAEEAQRVEDRARRARDADGWASKRSSFRTWRRAPS